MLSIPVLLLFIHAADLARVEAEACRHIVLLLTVRVKPGVVELGIAELRQDLVSEATTALGHTREHAIARISKFSRIHETRVLHRAQHLCWTHLVMIFTIGLLLLLVDALRHIDSPNRATSITYVPVVPMLIAATLEEILITQLS